MSHSQVNVDVDCELVGDFVDQGIKTTPGMIGQKVDVDTQLVWESIEYDLQQHPTRPFTILLKDGNRAIVRGRALKIIPKTDPSSAENYAILTHTNGKDVVVGLFPSHDVVGIFHGEMELTNTTSH